MSRNSYTKYSEYYDEYDFYYDCLDEWYQEDLDFVTKSIESNGCLCGNALHSYAYGSEESKYYSEMNRQSLYDSKFDRKKLDKIIDCTAEEREKMLEELSKIVAEKKEKLEKAKAEEKKLIEEKIKQKEEEKEREMEVLKERAKFLCISKSLIDLISTTKAPTNSTEIIHVIARDIVIQTNGDVYRQDLNSPWETILDMENSEVRSAIKRAKEYSYNLTGTYLDINLFIYMNSKSFKSQIQNILNGEKYE